MVQRKCSRIPEGGRKFLLFWDERGFLLLEGKVSVHSPLARDVACPSVFHLPGENINLRNRTLCSFQVKSPPTLSMPRTDALLQTPPPPKQRSQASESDTSKSHSLWKVTCRGLLLKCYSYFFFFLKYPFGAYYIKSWVKKDGHKKNRTSLKKKRKIHRRKENSTKALH